MLVQFLNADCYHSCLIVPWCQQLSCCVQLCTAKRCIHVLMIFVKCVRPWLCERMATANVPCMAFAVTQHNGMYEFGDAVQHVRTLCFDNRTRISSNWLWPTFYCIQDMPCCSASGLHAALTCEWMRLNAMIPNVTTECEMGWKAWYVTKYNTHHAHDIQRQPSQTQNRSTVITPKVTSKHFKNWQKRSLLSRYILVVEVSTGHESPDIPSDQEMWPMMVLYSGYVTISGQSHASKRLHKKLSIRRSLRCSSWTIEGHCTCCMV